jgi:DNA invertase Pin-like site-specific DNA recombinase
MLIGYMRVSSDGDRQNTNLQRDALMKAGVDERHLFEDKISGAKSNRPGLQQALDYVREGDVLVVWKLDRLGRSLSNLLDIVNLLRDRGVGFRSLTEQMDTTTAHGEFLFNVFGSLAQYERAGLEAAARRGKRGGRPRAISEDTLEAIKNTLEEGKTRAEACRIFGVKRGTLDDSLKRIGHV